MFLRVSLVMVLLCMAWPSVAGPLPVTCIRDMKEDPAQIRTLFDRVDRMQVRELFASNVRFYSADRGFIPIDDFVLRANFHDAREDESALVVRAIRRLQFNGAERHDAAYVVSTTRSAWFDRGSVATSNYTPISDTWLVSFSGCKIGTVREVPELSYLVDAERP